MSKTSILLTGILLFGWGCGGGGQTTPSGPISVTLTPSTANVHVTRSVQLTATVHNSTNGALTWSVSGTGCNGAACGTISNTGLYTAPASVPSPATITVTATSAADPSKSASATVTILAAVVVTVSPQNQFIDTGTTVQFTAVVQNAIDSSVTWSVSGLGCGGSSCGTISTTGFYTAPSAAPSVPAISVTATSVEDTATSDSVTATIVSVSNGVTITPKTLTISRGATQQFSASVAGSTDQTVYWEVNGTRGGDSVHGLISEGGVYIAPTTVPSPSTVTVTAVSFADATKSDTASVTIQPGSSVRVAIAGTGLPIVVPTFGSHPFSVTVTGTPNTAVSWQVNGVTGGSAVTGTISAAGVYYAPHSVPVSTAPNNDGMATDVIVTAVSQADATASDSAIAVPIPIQQGRFALPIPLGTTGGNAKDKSTIGSLTYCCSGTLGSLVSRGGNLYILSNNHVLARSDLASLGDPIAQPGLIYANCSTSGTSTVANLSQFFNLETGPLPNVDAAIAEIVPNAVDPMGTISQLGAATNGEQPTDGTPNPGPGVLPTIGRQVVKSGSATGLTCGTILAINASIYIQYQKGCNTGTTFIMNYVNQVDVSGVGFSAHGDSGSLIVTQDTADPVGLLYAGSDLDTVANPVADVLSQLADPISGEKPVFAGDAAVGAHLVAACTLPQPMAGTVQSLMKGRSDLSASQRQAAIDVRDAHAPELLARPEVRAVGVGASYDDPDEPVIVIFVISGLPRSNIPAQVDGVRTRIIEGESFEKSGSLSSAESEALERAVAPPQFVYPVSDAEVARARVVHSARARGLMRLSGVQGVGITSSVDCAGEAALMIFVIRGVPHDPIPPVIDGLRTRIRETSRFRER